MRGTELEPPGVWREPHAGVFLILGRMADRAVVFIDGDNWYHSFCDSRIDSQVFRELQRITRDHRLATGCPRIWFDDCYCLL